MSLLEKKSIGGARFVLLSDGARPTEDIYFFRSAAPILRAQGVLVERVDTRRWWNFKYLIKRRLLGSHVIICRSLGALWLDLLERLRPDLASVTYIIDDDLGAAAGADELPLVYRKRLTYTSVNLQPRILALANTVVASSDWLAASLKPRHSDVRALPPPLLNPIPDQTYVDDDSICIGYHGTRAHLADLEYLVPVIRRLHQEYPETNFEVMLGQHTPEGLLDLERLRSPAPMPWLRFIQYQSRKRIHIGLAPLLDTAFNRGKSHIKFLDIAAMGGVGVYSKRYPYTNIVDHGVDGLLVSDNLDDWYDALRLLITEPNQRRAMIQCASEKAATLGNVEQVVSLWKSILCQ